MPRKADGNKQKSRAEINELTNKYRMMLKTKKQDSSEKVEAYKRKHS